LGCGVGRECKLNPSLRRGLAGPHNEAFGRPFRSIPGLTSCSSNSMCRAGKPPERCMACPLSECSPLVAQTRPVAMR
jgi:hypothetical protein